LTCSVIPAEEEQMVKVKLESGIAFMDDNRQQRGPSARTDQLLHASSLV
jgi:hypothetical protein